MHTSFLNLVQKILRKSNDLNNKDAFGNWGPFILIKIYRNIMTVKNYNLKQYTFINNQKQSKRKEI